MTNFADVFARAWHSEAFPEGLDDILNGLKELGAEVMRDHKKMHLAEYIHAWADGVDVEYFENTFNQAGPIWKKVEFSHNWQAGCDFKYRLKPKTIKIGNIEVPEPMRVAPPPNAAFWVPQLVEGVPTIYSGVWYGDTDSLAQLENGFCHSTRDAALAHAKALVKVTKHALG